MSFRSAGWRREIPWGISQLLRSFETTRFYQESELLQGNVA